MTNDSGRFGNSHPNPATLVELLRWRATHQPEKRAYTFLTEGDAEETSLTYGELDRQARAIAVWLRSSIGVGERVLLLYPPGLPYIAAFFGCLDAGIISIPAYPPRLNRHLARLQAMATDAQATAVLTTTQILTKVRHGLNPSPELEALRWLSTDDLDGQLADEWHDPEVKTDTAAFLQYTSGSTAAPKGVVISHRNLLHNGRMIQEAFALSRETVIVSWLPLYHDMGLIGNMLQALYLGASCVLMSPVSFLQKPQRWLQAVSRYQATFSGGPNFAYDLCVSKITAEQRAELDLSSWRTAFNGAEPVRHQTIEQFAAAFAPHGFRREACHPVYGLAEATLFVAGKLHDGEPLTHPFSVAALKEHQAVSDTHPEVEARVLVSCGQTLLRQKIVVAHPESFTQCRPGQVGEIWVAGESVAQGYWNKPEETERTFKAFLADTGEGPFLRTGDLGFIKDDELFITGRLKDLIIIRGRNHYPQDIELTVKQSHPALRPGSGAAFTVEVEDEERLVVVQEVERHYRHERGAEIVQAIRQAVAQEHELEVYAVLLIKVGSLEKTSSGKIQRHTCREKFLSRSLAVVEESLAPVLAPGGFQAPPTVATGASPKIEVIQHWLVARIAEHLRVEPDQIDIRLPFSRQGLDSIGAIRISGDLEVWLGRQLSPTIVYEYPNIEALARHLAGERTVSDEASGRETGRERGREPVAIIGLGCRFPGARNPEAFWRLLSNGVDAIREIPAERWNTDAFYAVSPEEPGKANTRWGGFLEQIDQFDPHFFGISPREAACMDPQQRLLLEVAWEALEDAGQVREQLAGTRVGVFIGVSGNEYSRLQFSDPRLIDAYAGTGNALSIIANRLSYLFDLRGPSVAIDTACSSSLVAVHLACQSLHNGESRLAMAGGVNLILTPALTINFTKAGVMSPDGRCKAFDARANGYVRSEGAGVVILKRLSDALADDDPIYAVIMGTAVNQDGRTNGLMAPSRQAQEAVLEEAYRKAGVAPGDVQYVEAHGTGTFLGDPIEAKALGAVLSRGRPPGDDCAIGSVKTNIGHLEAASGIAGLMKVALSLKHRAIPPSLHFQTPNPHIPFDALPLRVQQTLSPWPGASSRALAGVSSFSFGGTNAHAVLADASQFSTTPPPRTVEENAPAHWLALSAHSPAALQAVAHAYRDFLSAEGSCASGRLHDICYTAGARRSQHDHRLSLVGHSSAEMSEHLGRFLSDEPSPNVSSGFKIHGQQQKLVFVFPGQGSQWPGMGRKLLSQEPVFRESIELCDRIMRKYADWSLLEELRRDETQARFDEIDFIQPAIFAMQISLAALWRSWGLEPHAVVGQSMGEVAAAYVSGSLSLEDAVRIICLRSRLLKRLRGRGAMAAVELSLEEARQALTGYESQLSVAVSNSPTSTVLAGNPAALEEVVGRLRERDIFCRLVKVDVASHSPQMEPLRDDLLHLLEGVRPVASSVPIYSTVTGALSDGQQFDAAYWMRNLREPVLFAEAMQRLVESDHRIFLEISPHPILLSAIQDGLHHLGREGKVLPSMVRAEEEREVMLRSLGALFVTGYPVAWNKFYSTGEKCTSLPSYPWQREHCWFDTEEGSIASGWVSRNWPHDDDAGRQPLLDRPLNSAFPADVYYWEVEVDRRRLSFLNDYRVHRAMVLPSTTYIEMALTAATKAFGSTRGILTEIEFQKPLFVPENGTRLVQIILTASSAAESSFRIYSRAQGIKQSDEPWLLHATGKIPLSDRVN